jgi:hypothetical protein
MKRDWRSQQNAAAEIAFSGVADGDPFLFLEWLTQ